MHSNLADVCLMEESLISDVNLITTLSGQWPGSSYWSPAVGRLGGVIVLISENFDGKIISWCKDPCGQVLSLLLEIADTHVNLINIYAPTILTERKSFFEGFMSFLFRLTAL